MILAAGDIAHPAPVASPDGRPWTVARYREMPEDGQRYELIEGTLYMTPAPLVPHQKTLGAIYRWLYAHLERGAFSGDVLVAPCDVYLGDDVVVQPDLLVITPDRLHLLGDDGFHGAPTVVVEVGSPGTATYDRHDKLLAYAKSGVPEYWLVDVQAKSLEILALRGGRFATHAISSGPADIRSPILGTLPGPVGRFFA
jgi:Uma2 family endonuclease